MGLVFILFPPNIAALISQHLIKFSMRGDNYNCPTPRNTVMEVKVQQRQKPAGVGFFFLNFNLHFFAQPFSQR